LVGAPTRSGLITRPLRERFGIPLRLVFYEPQELALIVSRGARVLGFALEADGAAEIARRARGTPRVAMRLLRRIRDFAAVQHWASVDATKADAGLSRLDVDHRGLDGMDRRYLTCIARNYGGGPVGVETMAAALGDQRDVIEEVIEPYLIQEGFVQRTPRGRMLTETAYRHLDLPVPTGVPGQFELLPPLQPAEEELP
jgi:Holliday junction DNA helicase RuvB